MSVIYYYAVGIDQGEEGTQTIQTYDNDKLMDAIQFAKDYHVSHQFSDYEGIFIDRWIHTKENGDDTDDTFSTIIIAEKPKATAEATKPDPIADYEVRVCIHDKSGTVNSSDNIEDHCYYLNDVIKVTWGLFFEKELLFESDNLLQVQQSYNHIKEILK